MKIASGHPVQFLCTKNGAKVPELDVQWTLVKNVHSDDGSTVQSLAIQSFKYVDTPSTKNALTCGSGRFEWTSSGHKKRRGLDKKERKYQRKKELIPQEKKQNPGPASRPVSERSTRVETS